MSKNWLRLLLVVAVLAVSLGFTVGAASAQTSYATYTVQPGDTLGRIAAKYCTTWTVIYNLNRNVIYNPNVIYPGMVLTVPLNCSGSDGGGQVPPPATCVDNGPRLHANGSYSAPYYTVAWGDTLFSIGNRFGISWQRIASANGLYYPTIYAGQRLTIPCGGSYPPPPPPPASQPGTPTRVNFDVGKNSLTTVGTISQGQPTSYVLWGNAKQTMTVETVSRGEALVISISGTGGALTLSGTNSQVSNTVTTILPTAGDYIVTIRPTTAPESPTLKFDITFSIK
jgi:LysM repeat protein